MLKEQRHILSEMMNAFTPREKELACRKEKPAVRVH
jgi:hypothetical protein